MLHYGFARTRPYHIPNAAADIRNLLQGCGCAFDPYIAVFNVENVESGIYYYSVSTERLSMLKLRDFRAAVCNSLIGHEQAFNAACTIFLVVDFPRFQWRYRHERALRNLYADVGRMAQYFILISTTFDVRNHITPAVNDDELGKLLSLDLETKQVFYSITLGC